MKLPFFHFIKAHHISRAALLAGVVVAAVTFFVIGAGLRLLWGPVSLGPLRATLAGAIHDALPGILLDYDQAAIEWSRDQGRVNLVVLGTRVYDSNGQVVATAPTADIDLAAAPFLQGRFVIKRITLVGVRFALVHMKDGRLRLATEGRPDSDDVIARLRAVINAHSSDSSALESFAVRDASLSILDETTGLNATAPRASLVMRSSRHRIATSFDSDVQIAGRTSHISADLSLPAGKGPISGSITVTGLDLGALGARTNLFKDLRDVPLVAGASSNFTISPAGSLAMMDFDLLARGDVPMGMFASKALHVQSLRLVGHYDGTSGHLSFSSVGLDARELRIVLRGGGDLSFAPGGELKRVHAELSARNIFVDMPGIFAQPLGYQSLQFVGDYLAQSRQVKVSKFALGAAGFAFESSGTITLNSGSGAPGLVANATLQPMPVRTLLRYWPLVIASGARNWVDKNIFAGTVGPLAARCNFPPGLLDQDIFPDDSLSVSFPMSGIEGNYVQGLTHATAVQGRGLLSGDTFQASFSSGRIGPLVASRGIALIPMLHQHGTVGQFSVHVDGAMPDVMSLLDMKPLNYPTKFGIDPKQTAGNVSAELAFKVPMLANLPVDDVGISAKASVSNFAVSIGSHLHLTDGNVNFDVDNDHLHQTGTVNLADSRMIVDWTEDFKTINPVTTHILVKGLLTEAARGALNMGMTRYFRGATPVIADITGHRGSLQHADTSVDFTPALLFIPIVNLEKSPGQPASGRVEINFAPGDVVQDESIHIVGPTLSAVGTANFNRSGSLTLLNFSSVKMGPLNDLSFQLSRGSNGNEYILRGHSLDGSKIGRNGSSELPTTASTLAAAQDESPEGHYFIDAKLDRLAMRDGVSIMPFNFELAGIGKRPSALALSGNLAMAGRTAPISASLEPSATGRKISVTSGDAGLLARGLFGFESLKGGELSATINLSGSASDPSTNTNAPDFTGTLTVRNFQVINQPLINRLFSAGSLTGLSDLMSGEGMSLEELTLPVTSKNNVIAVHGALVRGRAICATADGYLDRPKDLIALKGSLVPACGVNSVLGYIPLLGNVLVSKKGEGIFGVTYSLTGNAENPDLSTNPLSMLAPGFLRRIFQGRIPNPANAPSNAMANSPPPKPATTLH